MSRIGKTLMCIVAGLFIGVMAQAGDQATEKKLNKSDLPPAVQVTADRESAGGKVTGYSQGTDDGQIVYQVEMTTNGVPREVLIGSDGTVLAVQSEVQWDQLPADVQNGLKEQAGSNKLGKVSSVTKNGNVVGYETFVTRDGKREEIHVGPDGKLMTSSR
jgi:hypothetical protein